MFTSEPPATVAQYGSPGSYNYGWTLGTDSATHAANCTLEYAAPLTKDADSMAQNPYAVIHMFAKVRSLATATVRAHLPSCTPRVSLTPPNARAPLLLLRAIGQDPTLPNMFGVEVNSNVHAATVTLFTGLFGNQSTTEVTTFIHIAPGQQ